MTTTFRHNEAMATAVLDGGYLIFCALPGGRPMLVAPNCPDRAVSITDAPTCDSSAAFRSFVTDRFGS